jgi:hypothetical protein
MSHSAASDEEFTSTSSPAPLLLKEKGTGVEVATLKRACQCQREGIS